MLHKEAKKELDKYNKEKEANYKPHSHRLANIHEQDHDDEDIPDNPEPDLDNHYVKDPYPMQDLDIEELIDSHGNYSAKMAFHTTFPSILLLLLGL